MNPLNILEDIGCPVSLCDREDLGPTRDVPSVHAYRDPSGVVYLSKDVGHDYAGKGVPEQTAMMTRDDERRGRMFGGYLMKPYLDFGCGNGRFARDFNGYGVDPCLDDSWYGGFTSLDALGVACVRGVFQIVTAFHVVEHLSDPIDTLAELRSYMAPGARLIVEVPHARDWLLTNCEAFRRFSLWSEHLILHTRETLSALLRTAGFVVDRIEGFQRYPLSNHHHWLTKGEPGCFDEEHALDREYANLLCKRDETDTLIAWARVPVRALEVA